MFIYVMDTKSKDILLEHGYELLKANERQNIWVFENKKDKQFDILDIQYVISDVLTF